MRSLILSTLIFFSFATSAFQPSSVMDQLCEEAIQYTSTNTSFFKRNILLHNEYAGQHYYLVSRWNKKRANYLLTPQDYLELKAYSQKIYDMAATDQALWMTTARGLEKFDLQGRHLKTFTLPGDLTTKAPLLRSVVYSQQDDALYLAASQRGLMRFNLSDETFSVVHLLKEANQNGHRSHAVAIAQDSERFYIVLSGITRDGFHGFVTYNRLTRSIEHMAAYDKRYSGVIDPAVQITASDAKIYLNNGGWLHHYTKQDILTKKRLRLSWMPISRPSSSGGTQYVRLIGGLVSEAENLLACGSYKRKDMSTGRNRSFSKSYTLKKP